MDKRHLLTIKGHHRGQSFVELMLIILILALILAGVVEFGFLMNQYLHVLDAAREGARFASGYSPFVIDYYGHVTNYYSENFYEGTTLKVAQTLNPIIFDPVNADDIVISVFSVGGPDPVRFPTGMDDGWSLCAHFSDFQAYLNDPNDDGNTSDHVDMPAALNSGNWASCATRISQYSVANVKNTLNGLDAPPTGIVVVEIYYNYPQLLKLPGLTTVLPDPIPLYLYSVMPLSAAEPTAVP